MSEKIKYWWSEDRQWFCIRIKGETASLTVAEAEELMGEVQQTPSFLALQEEAAQRAVELMEQSRATAGSERIDIVERLRFDATRCELQFSKGVAGNINDAAAEIERLRGLVPTPAQGPLQSRDDTLRGLAAFFDESEHLVWSNDEIADCLTGMIAAQPPAAPVETKPAWCQGADAVCHHPACTCVEPDWKQDHAETSRLKPAAPVETRKTFTIPPGYEAVRDGEGRATGEVRPQAHNGSSAGSDPVAWTNEAQLGFLKDPNYALIPMAMWAERADKYADVPLYRAVPQPTLDRDAVIRAIHKSVDVRDLFDGAQELIGVDNAADAILALTRPHGGRE
jgi:hypothetical protein